MSSRHTYIRGDWIWPETSIVRNPDYNIIGSEYAHVVIWREHHGVWLDPHVFIIHHRNHNKRDNRVCKDDSGKCPRWDCGNLGAMTRADHIREHRPGRMGGAGFPGKKPKKQNACSSCGKPKSRNGDRCRGCYLAKPTLAN